MDPAVEEWVHWSLVTDPRTAEWFGFRVSPVVAEESATITPDGDVLPFAVYRTIATVRSPVLDLSMPDAPVVTVSVDTYAGTYTAAKAAAAAVRDVLNKATEPRYGTKLLVSLQQTGQDDYAIPVNGKEVPVYSVTQTFDITYDE